MAKIKLPKTVYQRIDDNTFGEYLRPIQHNLSGGYRYIKIPADILVQHPCIANMHFVVSDGGGAVDVQGNKGYYCILAETGTMIGGMHIRQSDVMGAVHSVLRLTKREVLEKSLLYGIAQYNYLMYKMNIENPCRGITP